MESIIYSSPETAPVDNLTIIKRLPYNGKVYAYYASNYGQIFSFNGKRVQVINTRGKRYNPGSIAHMCTDYERVCGDPKKGNVIGQKFIHRLVAEVFCPNSNPLRKQVDHIDNNPRNNRADNLRWCTQSENIRYAREIRTGERIITNLQRSLFYVKH